MELAEMKRLIAFRRAERLRREHLTVEEAFGGFADHLRGTRRGVRSTRKDLFRMFWYWNAEYWGGPIFKTSFPIEEVLRSFKFLERAGYNSHVPHLFANLVWEIGPWLREFPSVETAMRAKRALAKAQSESRLASYLRDIDTDRALTAWRSFFGPAFPKTRTEAGLPLYP